MKNKPEVKIENKEILEKEISVENGRYQIDAKVINGNLQTLYLFQVKSNHHSQLYINGGINDLKDIADAIDIMIETLER